MTYLITTPQNCQGYQKQGNYQLLGLPAQDGNRTRLRTHLLYRTHQLIPIYRAIPSEEGLRVDWTPSAQERDGDMVIKRTPSPDAENCNGGDEYWRTESSFVCTWAQKKQPQFKRATSLPNQPSNSAKRWKSYWNSLWVRRTGEHLKLPHPTESTHRSRVWMP